MDWLKRILESVAGADALAKQIQDEIGRKFVDRDDFNTKNEKVRELTGKVEELDKTIKANGDSVKKITELQAKYDEAIATHTKYRQDAALDAKLAKSGSKNPKAFKALLDMTKITFKDDGTVEGYDEQETALKKSDGYLFGEVAKPSRVSPNPNPGTPPPEGGEENLGVKLAKERAASLGQGNTQFNALFGIGEKK